MLVSHRLGFILGMTTLALLMFCGCSSDNADPQERVTTVTETPQPSPTIVSPVKILTSTPSPSADLGEKAAATVQPSPVPSATGEADDSGQNPNADVEYVRAVRMADGSWTFHVTVRHPDTGWEDYADGWDVVTTDGTILKRDPADLFTRLLLHPHETEQPFTRSQSGLQIPAGISQVVVRAHDLVDGYGGREVIVDLGIGSGRDFVVEKQ